MANRNRREALRGAEEETFDLLAEALTSDQWAELLKAPLKHAAANGNKRLGKKLMGAGAKIGNALHAAARRGHAEVVGDLLEKGAAVDAKGKSGRNPLHLAALAGKTKVVHLLLLKGADKDALDNYGYSPLYLAVWFDHVAAALTLLTAGADVSLRCDELKKSVVHEAAQDGHADIVSAAIEQGADVDAVDTNQCTPLHYAAFSNKKGKAIGVLVEAGAKIQARDAKGYTSLHYAARHLDRETLLVLLKHGAHVNALDRNRKTPLLLAAREAGTGGAAEVVDLLLRAGADETILNSEGKAAADVVGDNVGAEDGSLDEDVDRVYYLLANAPADRAWRRRGYLLLCRAHLDKMQQIQESGSASAGTAQGARSSAKLGRTETGNICTGIADGSLADGWTVVVAKILRLQEEGIFRSIVGYL